MTTISSSSSPALPTTALAPMAGTAAADTPATAESKKLSGVAKQFEAIFLRQMLASARKTNFAGDDNVFSGKGLDTFRQMQDERFADIASETGSFGLGKMIETHLAKFAQAAGAGSAATGQTAANQGVTSNGI